MRRVVHRLVGYHSRLETLQFSIDIPPAFLRDVRKIIRVDEDDPQMVGCYEITRKVAKRIAAILGVDLPTNLAFFVEPFLVPIPVTHHPDARL